MPQLQTTLVLSSMLQLKYRKAKSERVKSTRNVFKKNSKLREGVFSVLLHPLYFCMSAGLLHENLHRNHNRVVSSRFPVSTSANLSLSLTFTALCLELLIFHHQTAPLCLTPLGIHMYWNKRDGWHPHLLVFRGFTHSSFMPSHSYINFKFQTAVFAPAYS